MFSKKNKRKITVNNEVYYWTASGNDGWINLYIMTETPRAPKLICYFDYHHELVPKKEGKTSCSNQFVITPYIVRQSIEYGLAKGWTPFEKGKNLNLGHIDDFIDLRLDRNKENVIGRTRE